MPPTRCSLSVALRLDPAPHGSVPVGCITANRAEKPTMPERTALPSILPPVSPEAALKPGGAGPLRPRSDCAPALGISTPMTAKISSLAPIAAPAGRTRLLINAAPMANI